MMLPFSQRLSQLGMVLDHPHGAIGPWAKRVPWLVYPSILGYQLGKDVFQNKDPDARNKRLRDDSIRFGIPSLATALATHFFMMPDAQAYNSPLAARQYFQAQGRPVFEVGQERARKNYQALKPLAFPLWGRLEPQKKLASASALDTFQRVESAGPALDIQVKHTIKAIAQGHEDALKKAESPQAQAQLYQTFLQHFEALKTHAERVVLQRALALENDGPIRAFAAQNQNPKNFQALVGWVKNLPEQERDATREAILQFELPLRIAEDIQHFSTHSNTPLQKRLPALSASLLRQEVRFALPTNEDLCNFAGAFEGGQFSSSNLWKAMKRTGHEFIREAAGPFLVVGGISVGSGVLAGFWANALEGQSNTKNADVVKEGIFQYVANIAMCGFGAGLGLTVANAMGFTKFRNPLARLLTIIGGLGLGIISGAQLANPLSDKVEALVNHYRKAPPPASAAGRKLEATDGLLHVDDVPTAFSVAGVQVLKPWIPPFFLLSGIKTAFGYRNVEPLAHLSPVTIDEHMTRPRRTLAKPLAPQAAFSTVR